MPKPAKVSICFVQNCTIFLEHLWTTNSEYSQIDSRKYHKLVSCLMMSGPAITGRWEGGAMKGRLRLWEKKRKSLKAETIKRLSTRSKFYYFNHSRASRIKKFFLSANYVGRQYFSVFHGPLTLKSISAALVVGEI